MAPRPDNSLARALGQFVGHIWKGVRADVSREAREVDRRVEHHTAVDAQGRTVTLRRTTIDEIEITDDDRPPRTTTDAPR
mgnify:CR=1 FL=1